MPDLAQIATPVPALRLPAHRVSRRALGYWTVRAALGWLVLIAGQVVWLLLDGSHAGAHLSGLGGTVLLAAVHLIVMPQWRYRVHRWEATGEAVYTQSGWVSQQRRVAPVTRIQTVDTSRGPLEQVFRLTNVTVTTASAAGPLEIRGLDRTVAERLVHELTVTTQAARHDAT